MERVKEKAYTPEGIRSLRLRADRAKKAALAVGLGALVICAALCVGVRTKNADFRREAAIALSTLGAWAALALTEGVRTPLRREIEHEEGVLREAEETVEGEIRAVGGRHPIPKSITFRPVTLRTAEGERVLKLNARWEDSFPGAGRHIRARVRRGYLTEWTAEEEEKTAGSPLPAEKDGRRWIRRALRAVHQGILCLAACALLVSWVFTFLTDAPAGEKVVLFINAREGRWQEMAVALEETAPQGIRTVQVRPFSYALMNSQGLRQADLYLMTAGQAQEHPDWIAEIPRDLAGRADLAGRTVTVSAPGDPAEASAGKTEKQGTEAGDPPAEGTEDGAPENRKTVTGLRVISSGGAAAWFRSDAGTEEDWLLFFGAQSPHAGERDRAALEVAEDLIRLLNPD